MDKRDFTTVDAISARQPQARQPTARQPQPGPAAAGAAPGGTRRDYRQLGSQICMFQVFWEIGIPVSTGNSQTKLVITNAR